MQALFQLGRAAEQLGLGDLSRHVSEVQADEQLLADFEAVVADVPGFTKSFGGVYDFRLFRFGLYALMRETGPLVVVETGVMNGMGTSFILAALDRNDSGSLISVDLPSPAEEGPASADGFKETLPHSKEPGWMVPLRLRDRWDLRLGSSDDLLSAIAEEHDLVDVFIHDSDHSYGVMWRELEWAWSHTRPGGLIVCDNIDSCTAFFDWARAHGRTPSLLSSPNISREEAIRTGIVKR